MSPSDKKNVVAWYRAYISEEFIDPHAGFMELTGINDHSQAKGLAFKIAYKVSRSPMMISMSEVSFFE